MAANKTSYTYECKCRRCGRNTELTIGGHSLYQHFKAYIDGLIQIPKQSYCYKCKKNTVMEVVSYEEDVQQMPDLGTKSLFISGDTSRSSTINTGEDDGEGYFR